MVEMAPTEDGTYRMGFAGDTFNTAWYARRLLGPDWAVDYASCVGTDATSARMLDFMSAAGIGTGHIRRLSDRTVGLYMIQLDRGERSFSYWRGQSAARMLADDPAWLDAVCATAGVVFYSGITLAILSDGARATFCAALGRVRAQGVTTVLDTNMRPRLWAGAEHMRAGIMQGAAVADIVLPSLDEEQATFGDATAQAVAARYHDAGAGLVVVKNGAGDVLAAPRGGEAVTVPTVPVAEVVDSTAAGDSFDAGFLAAYLQGEALAQAVGQGARLAARVVQARGALVDPAPSPAKA